MRPAAPSQSVPQTEDAETAVVQDTPLVSVLTHSMQIEPMNDVTMHASRTVTENAAELTTDPSYDNDSQTYW